MCWLHEALGEDALDAKRRRWLGFHDQQTGGIMGLLPLVRGLPVRLTHPENRNHKLFKNSKCTIHSWTLDKREAFVILCFVCLFFSRKSVWTQGSRCQAL